MEKLALSPEQAREVLGLGRGLMYEKLRDGTIKSVRVGRRILVPQKSLVEFLEGKDLPGVASLPDMEE